MLKQTREKKIIPVYPEEPADLEERFGPEKPPDPDELESPVTIQNNNKKKTVRILKCFPKKKKQTRITEES